MRGGSGSAQVIPLLDFDAIAETAKAFVRRQGACDPGALLENSRPVEEETR
jgi:hypothetical protein